MIRPVILCPVFLCVLFACLAPACSRMPELEPVADSPEKTIQQACRMVFPTGRWQFVHSIEAVFPGGGEELLMGVTVVDAGARTIACALMTVEGFVLFRAHRGERIRVERAVPPFDKKGFAHGLMDDMALLFLAPAAKEVRTGRFPGKELPSGVDICRYVEENGRITDVIPGLRWQLHRYNSQGGLTRTVVADDSGSKEGAPGRMELKAPGLAGYTLKMILVDATRID